MTKETLRRAMMLHQEIQKANKLLEDMVNADAIMLTHKSASNHVVTQELPVSEQASLIAALSHYVVALNRKMEDL